MSLFLCAMLKPSKTTTSQKNSDLIALHSVRNTPMILVNTTCYSPAVLLDDEVQGPAVHVLHADVDLAVRVERAVET